MKTLRFAALFAAFLSSFLTAFSQQVKSPNEFLPHKLGEKFTPHYLLNNYFEYLAGVETSTMKLQKYGLTNEDRPLQIAIISSPENMARLEQIRLNNLRLAGLADGEGSVENPTPIVWISFSVHGNEASGSEASMLLAYDLATQTDPKIREYLKNTVVILDPSLNPDGYDRYTSWNRGVSNLQKNINPEAREHQEPWPGGRVNHYYFDLNRDWAWATQTETRQRLAVFQNWLPEVHPDVHEQGINAPYYFAPAAEPTHELVTSWQRNFQSEIGENNARHFDNHGWLYFTKEIYDLFYPSYGDTYPTFNGSIGMTYEQGGGPRGGRAVEKENGDTLTLHDRILHHYTTCLSTIEICSKSAKVLVENFRDYYKKSNTQPWGQYKAFVIRAVNDPNKINALCELLDRQHIHYGRVGAGMSGVRAFDYERGQETSVSINPNDVVISAYQPHSVLAQALLEPEARLMDSMTYDITAWSLPFAYGLEAYALKDRLEPKKPYEKYVAPEVMLAASPYAWCIHRRSWKESEFVAQLLQKGVNVRTSMGAFDIADQHFAPGAFVITRADNRAVLNNLDQLVKEAAAKTNVQLQAIFTGYSNRGADLGSENFRLIKQPKVAVLYSDDVDENAYGQAWYYFEQELKYPFTPVQVSRLSKINLRQFTAIVFPGGQYDLDDKTMDALKTWMRGGGRIIAVEGAVKAFADKDGFEIKTREMPKKDSASLKKPYYLRQRDGLSDQLPGAIVRAKADDSHPLAFGLGETYYSLKTVSDAYEISDNAETAVYLEDNYLSFGFIGSRLKPQLRKTPIAAVQNIGDGSIVYFVDNPLFRAFWQQGKMLFANALFD